VVRTSFIFEISIFFRQLSHQESAIINQGGQAMEEVKKLELKIKNSSSYEEIIKQSKKIDKYIDKIIEEAL
jgi:hypothetical protein